MIGWVGFEPTTPHSNEFQLRLISSTEAAKTIVQIYTIKRLCHKQVQKVSKQKWIKFFEIFDESEEIFIFVFKNLQQNPRKYNFK